MPSSQTVATNMGATAVIAEFAVSTGIEDFPHEVVDHARLVILDTIGGMLAALDFPIGRITTGYVADLGGRPDARIVGTEIRVSAPLAAYANGTLAHALDFDDHKHLSTHTLPAALAVGELVGATTADVMGAYVLGREVGAKLGAVIEAQRKFKRGPTYRGWYRVGVVGPIAAAVSAGVVLRLDVTQMRNAIGIAATSSGGLRRNQGTMAKALHAGNGASDGVHAALLSARGFTGDDAILESELGLVSAICLPGEADWSVLTRLGEPYDLAGEPGIKCFPSCSPSHRPIAAALRLRRENDFGVDDIVSVEADVHPFSLLRADPQEAIATGYSLPYLLSVALLDGRVGLDQVGDSRLNDPRVRGLIAKVHHDPSAAPADGPERVTVRLSDGRVLVAEQAVKPDLHGEGPVTDKFNDCAGRLLDVGEVERLRAAIAAVPGDVRVSDLLDLTVREPAMTTPGSEQRR
jgi:2-methylcitrate dehydratase PrpD